MKEMGRRSREGERITWSERACLLSFAMVCGGGDGGWTRWRCCFSSSSPCRGANPCVFSSSFSFCFPSCYSRLFIFVLLLSSFSLFLCFFSFFPPLFFSLSVFFFSIFLFLLCCSLFFCSLFPCIYRQIHRERGLLPLSSHGTGVGWLGWLLCNCPRTARGARPFCFSPRGRPRVRA